jgi:hypothetical protein
MKGAVMKITTALLLCIAVSIMVRLSLGYSQPVVFTITTDKPEYLSAEQIYARIVVRNVGQHELVRISSTLLSDGLVLKNSAGIQFKPAILFDIEVSDSDRLAPGDSLGSCRDLNDYFCSGYGSINYCALAPDLYTVYCEIEFHYDQSIGLNSHIARSNEIQFRVLAPEGIEREAIDLLNLSFIEIFKGRAGDLDKSQEILERFIAEYSNSVYLGLAYQTFIGVCKYNPEYQSLLFKYSHQCLNHIPNNYYSRMASANIQRIFQKNSDPQGARAFFQEIIRTHPGTIAAKDAEWRISLIDHLPLQQWIDGNFSNKQLEDMGLGSPLF